MELKKLVCENCGSSDFSYQDNIYTCRHCGTKYVLANDGNYIIYNYNYNISFDDFADSADYSTENTPASKGSGLRNLLFIFVGFIMLFGSCMFLGDDKEITSPVVAQKNEVKELLTKANHPKLFSSRADVKKFYEGQGNIVKLHPSEYDDKTVLYIKTMSDTVYKDYTDASARVKDIQIYLSNAQETNNIKIDEAVDIAETFIPWEIMDEYYELDETKCADNLSAANHERYYDIRYRLKERYLSNYMVHGYPGSITIRFKADTNNRVENIRIAIRLDRLGGRLDNNYKFTEWKPANWHQSPKEPPYLQKSWELLSSSEHPRLLDNYDDMLTFGKKFIEEAVYFNKTSTNEKYGIKGKKCLLSVESMSRADKSDYVFVIFLDLAKLRDEKQVSLAEAIALTKTFLPYDIMQEYYKLNFARKKVPTAKNLDGKITYEVVYDRIVSSENRAKARQLELPANIHITIQAEENGNVLGIWVNGYKYIPRNTSTYENATNEFGQRIEIRHEGRELGPYEESDDWNTVMPWQNPF